MPKSTPKALADLMPQPESVSSTSATTPNVFGKQLLDFASNQRVWLPIAGGMALAALGLGIYYYARDTAQKKSIGPKSNLIQAYVESAYPHMQLSESEMNQLIWIESLRDDLRDTTAASADASTVSSGVQGLLARRHGLDLVLQGDEKAYHEFTQGQPSSQMLSRDNFDTIVLWVKNLSPEALATLKLSLFVVTPNTLSRDSKQLKDHSLQSKQSCTSFMPALDGMTEKQKKLLQCVLLPNASLKSMIFTEGGNAMFASLRAAVKQNGFDEEALDVWFLRSVLSLRRVSLAAGLRGNLLLNRSTMEDLKTVKDILSKQLKTEQEDCLESLLNYEYTKLKLDSPRAPIHFERLCYLAHLGAMMRLATPCEGAELLSWYKSRDRVQHDLMAKFRCFQNKFTMTPLFEVAFLDTLRSLKCSISEIASIHSSIKLIAIPEYFKQLDSKEMPLDAPLSYKALARPEVALAIVGHYKEYLTLPHLTIDINGEIRFVDRSLIKSIPMSPRAGV